MKRSTWAGLMAGVAVLTTSPSMAQDAGLKPSVRDWGRAPGVLPTGPLNAITDVEGVRVGQVTLNHGAGVRTGVTAIIPHGGDVFRDRVPAALKVANGYGKLAGATQIRELGELETPIVLTNTLSVAAAMEGIIRWTLDQPGHEDIRSVNAVVGETNDGGLNDIRGLHVTPAHVIEAITTARTGPVAEGAVGAGTGTIAFGFKGGIGTSSRRLPRSLGGHTVGVLVQSNYGGLLTIDGVPVGAEIGRYYLKDAVEAEKPDGSIMIIVATDAPLSDRNLERLAERTFAGLARTGAAYSNGSGDYAIAFSTAESVRRTPERREGLANYEDWPNDRMSPLFVAVAEATEEAILNSMLRAETVRSVVNGREVVIEALDGEQVRQILDRARPLSAR
ncbi:MULTISPECIES: P1 family peptidase [unclassified Brevundimonas]|uniref:DmpA family aminopeptidase n=1 Tax=unclassified Brevundimonas TaxID=2622653 RepID=UPI0025C32829|nr:MULTISPECIES: P1 family peptidase [unclassified Brevundimonas]